MLRRHFLATALAAQQPRRKPNIVVLLADDLGYGELGFQGNTDFPTPHLDSIANNGVRFTQGYVSAPYCCPSRAGLMTGRYQTRFGHELNAIGKRNLDPQVGLPLTERTMANHLKDAGYRTGLIGKWHLGGVDKFHPQNRGFDEFYGFLHEGHFYYPPPYRGALTRLRTNEPPYDDDNPILRGKDPVEEKAYLTDALAREASSFIDRNREQPFFLYLAFNAIHSPMQAPVAMLEEFENLKGEQRRLFAAMTRSMDNATGQVLSAELTSSNKPLRGGKGQLFEGGIRVPFAMQWRGRIAPSVNNQPAISLDILPTALAAAGLNALANLDGINLLNPQAQAKRDTMFWRYGPSLALRKGNHKIVQQRGPNQMLFDLDKDPGETTDLSASQPALKASLLAELNTLNGQMVPPLWN
jgi:arylsulfatase A-like enzyme